MRSRNNHEEVGLQYVHNTTTYAQQYYVVLPPRQDSARVIVQGRKFKGYVHGETMKIYGFYLVNYNSYAMTPLPQESCRP